METQSRDKTLGLRVLLWCKAKVAPDTMVHGPFGAGAK